MDEEKSPVTETSSFLMMLPNDMLLNCIARVSRMYYPTLSLVSKKFRSLLSSLELYETRTLLCRTESCAYVCLRFYDDHYSNSSSERWFTLCRKPTDITDLNTNPNPRLFTPCFRPFRFLTKKKKKSSDNNILVLVPTRNPSNKIWWDVMAVGCNVYKVGYSSSTVTFMDCRSHTWHKAPSMRVARKAFKVNFYDGKIYIAGGTKTQIWEKVPSPGADICKSRILNTLVIKGKLYLLGESRNVVYKPKEHRWDTIESVRVLLGWLSYSSCVIDNILYFHRTCGKLEWYDFEGRCFRALKGLKKLPKLSIVYTRLVDYGGNIGVLWEKVVREEKRIWFAEISLEKRNPDEIYGKLEWCKVVLTVPISCDVLKLLAATV